MISSRFQVSTILPSVPVPGSSPRPCLRPTIRTPFRTAPDSRDVRCRSRDASGRSGQRREAAARNSSREGADGTGDTALTPLRPRAPHSQGDARNPGGPHHRVGMFRNARTA
jgi:hypothetical protein